MLKQGTNPFFAHNFSYYSSDFSIRKKFWKAEMLEMLCMLKGSKSYFDFQPLQHASTYIALDDIFGKV